MGPQRAVPQREEAGLALPSASRALGVQSLPCKEEDVRAHGTCPCTRGQGVRGCWGSSPVGPGEVGRCGVGQRSAPRRLCELGCFRFKEGSEVPAQACAPEREDCLQGGQPLFPGSLLALGRGSGWLRIGRAP